MKQLPIATQEKWWINSDIEDGSLNAIKTTASPLKASNYTYHTAPLDSETTSVASDNSQKNWTIIYSSVKAAELSLPADNTENKEINRLVLYPQYFDSGTESGEAIKLLQNTLEHLNKALDFLCEPDMEAVVTCISTVSTTINNCHKKANFNKSFRAIIGFTRRALIQTDITEISVDSLNQLIYVINELSKNPMISLVDATRLSSLLKNHGWNGDDALADKLLNALIAQLSDEPQQSLFEDRLA